METVAFKGSKGGVGTTTIACAYALDRANNQKETALCGVDPISMAGTLGTAQDLYEDMLITSCLEYRPSRGEIYDYLVTDAGRFAPKDVKVGRNDEEDESEALWREARHRILVVTNDYLSLRSAVQHYWEMDFVTAYVLVEQADRPLRVSEVVDVLGDHPLVVIPWTIEIARASDAGMLALRRPEQLFYPISKMAAFIDELEI